MNLQKIGLKRLDTYIIWKFLGTFFFSIVVILSIAVVFDVTEKIDDFYEHNANLHAIVFDYYMSFLPYYAYLFTPLFSYSGQWSKFQPVNASLFFRFDDYYCFCFPARSFCHPIVNRKTD